MVVKLVVNNAIAAIDAATVAKILQTDDRDLLLAILAPKECLLLRIRQLHFRQLQTTSPRQYRQRWHHVAYHSNQFAVASWRADYAMQDPKSLLQLGRLKRR